MNILDSEKVPYPCGKDKCGHSPDLCGVKSNCVRWEAWLHAKWPEVTKPFKRMSKQRQKVITPEKTLNSLFRSSKCPIAFPNREVLENAAEWLVASGVMIPPCKPGDVLWYVGEGKVECDAVRRIQFIQSEEEYKSQAEGWVVFGGKKRFHGCDIGASVFFNMRDAEAYAVKMKGE